VEPRLGQVLSRYPRGDRGCLIPVLQETQDLFGYISPESLDEISAWAQVPPGEAYGVVSFYTQFRLTRPGRHTVKVCLGTACHVRGGARILELLEYQLGVQEGQTTPDGGFTLERVACFGCCALAPVVMVDKDIHARMKSTRTMKLLKRYNGRAAQ